MAARLTAFLVGAIVIVTVIAGLIVGAQREDLNGPVDLIIYNGRVFTAGEPRFAEAVAVRGNTILRVGSNREINRLRRAQTRVIDARGGSVVPGFNDARVDLFAAEARSTQVDLRDAQDLDDVAAEVTAFAAAHPHHEWVEGNGLDADAFATLPSREDLDRVLPGRPLHIVDADRTLAIANSQALARAGIGRGTPDPGDGAIERDETSGEPTGLLRAAARDLLEAARPRPDRNTRLAALRRLLEDVAEVGVTSIQITGDAEEIALLESLRRGEGLPVRVFAARPLDADHDDQGEASSSAARDDRDDPVLKTTAVAWTADDDPDEWTGRVAALLAAASDSGSQPWIDASETDRWSSVLDTLADEQREDDELRHRLVVTDRVLAEVAEAAPADIVLTTVPDTPPAATETLEIGPPIPSSVPDLTTISSVVAIGTSWPEGDPTPTARLALLLDAQDDAGTAPLPEERLAAALVAYTRNGALASADEGRKGTLAPGMLADIVILSTDLFALPAARLHEAIVEATIMNGEVVYMRRAETSE